MFLEGLPSETRIERLHRSILSEKCLRPFLWSLFRSSKDDSAAAEAAVRALGLSADVSRDVLRVVSDHKSEIGRLLIEETTLMGPRTLRNFDWRSSITVASNNSSALRVPLILLTLYITGPEGPEKVVLEMSEDELSRLISSLSEADQVLRLSGY